jgi:poly(hydroxyalkanoate) granule-associated protein
VFNPTQWSAIMAKKPVEILAENRLLRQVKESGHEIWLAGLGAFAKAQEEGEKVFNALVKEGRQLEAKTRQMAGGRVEELASRASGTIDRLEKVFEERVARALKSLGVPTAQEVEQLSRRVAELTRQVETLVGKPARRRPGMKRVVKMKQAA